MCYRPMHCVGFLFMFLVITFCLPACNNSKDSTEIPVISTRSGDVRGIENESSYAYLGIPYASPPVGELRWKRPRRETPWNGVRNADTFAPACPQDLSGMNMELYGLTQCDEDCLYLNVWTPKPFGKRALPVMFWIHGGGYISGSASQDLYDGAPFAEKGVVLVSINFRLGPLGFMAHKDIFESEGQAGNYGLYDTLAALEWVQENIAAFGGDPSNVTIFGQSAGSCSVSLLQTAPQAEGLFHRAIAQSGVMASTPFVLNLTGSWEEAAENGEILQALLGAASIDEMRSVPAEEIISVATEEALYFGPVIDGEIIRDDFRKMALEPVHAPMMIGSTKDEGTLFIYEYGIKSLFDYEQALDVWFGKNAELVTSYYPAQTDEEAVFQAATIHGLAGFQEPTRLTARAASKHTTVYRYYFAYTPPTEFGYYLGSFHGAELDYIFCNLNPEEGYGEKDAILSETLRDLWTSFATSGTPTAKNAPVWPEYDEQEEAVLVINGAGDLSVSHGLEFDDQCDLFASIASEVTPDYPQ